MASPQRLQWIPGLLLHQLRAGLTVRGIGAAAAGRRVWAAGPSRSLSGDMRQLRDGPQRNNHAGRAGPGGFFLHRLLQAFVRDGGRPGR